MRDGETMSYTQQSRIGILAASLALIALLTAQARVEPAVVAAPKLKLVEIGSDSTAFHVIATLVVGPTEVLLWDAQYHAADARRVADAVAATGRHLKAIILSHPDHDHFSGAAIIVERFPGTPVYMTAAALDWYRRTAEQAFRAERSRRPEMFADSLIKPQQLPSNTLTVDGEVVEVIPDLYGDVIEPVNSILWIPSLRTVLAGDVVFNGVHAWLGSSDPSSRRAWRSSIQRIAALQPLAVVAGHKKDASSADSPAVLRQMDRYLADFDSLRLASVGSRELRDAMVAKYPDLAVQSLVAPGAFAAFRSAAAPAAQAQVPATESGLRTATGQHIPLTFDVSVANGVVTMSLNSEGHGSFQARNVEYDGTSLSFVFTPDRDITCALRNQSGGSFRGPCTAEAGSGTMEMSPNTTHR
jgi:glyoxylase-like metal-dependent hydrolase (beta-lactamase superfamily II)